MVQGIAARRKRYVEVEATFLEDGRIVPRAVVWHDGRRFPVRAVLGVRTCASLKVGGAGEMCIRDSLGHEEVRHARAGAHGGFHRVPPG